MTVCPLPTGASAALARALDRAWLLAAVRQHLAPDAEVQTASADYVRYKAQHGSLVGWRVCVRDANGEHATWVTARCADPARLANEARRLRGRKESVHAGLRGTPALVDDVLLMAFPVDRALRGLRWLLRASRAKALVQEHRAEWIAPGYRVSKRRSHAELVRYKPERRAVLRWRLGTVDEARRGGPEVTAFVRLHAEPIAARAVAALNAAAAGGVRCPARAKAVHERLAIEEAIDGRPAGRQADLGERVGALLARLHRVACPPQLPECDAGAVLGEARAAVDGLQLLQPRLGEAAARVLDRLGARASAAVAPVFAHGDFHRGQLLDAACDLGVVDFDRAAAAPAARDLAEYCAHEIGLDPSQGDPEQRLDGLGAALLAGYEAGGGAPPAALAWHLAAALLRQAVRPFRELRADWPEQAQSLLHLAARVAEAKQ